MWLVQRKVGRDMCGYRETRLEIIHVMDDKDLNQSGGGGYEKKYMDLKYFVERFIDHKS